ncbi:hypothetical protein [uncultured Ruminococcus sp.]|uniref:hypothetical protein n=1 Tax=uncultured Ruminococcus sp. TaxID=165186 RepID=UPI0025D63866|nr:hypothetical protein [uncultured Ruminococcus sp.]
MVKTNILTPVLAGILGLSIVGSGVGYYFVNKNASAENEESGKVKLSQVADNINNTMDDAKKAINGELDFAYDASVKVTFGEGFKEITGTDTTYLPFSINTSTKQKGKNTGADFTMKYGDGTLATLNTVYTRDGDTVYAKVPELSDAYLKTDKASLESLISDEMGVDFNSVQDSIPDIDFSTEDMQSSIDGYEAAIKENLPEGTADGEYKGDIDGITYTYTKTKYVITEADASKVANAVLDKAKTDANFKSIYDSYINEVYGSMLTTNTDPESDYSYTPPTYEETIDSIKEDLNDTLDGTGTDSVTFVSYKNSDGEFMGFSMTPNDTDGSLDYVVVSTDDAEGIDMSFDSGDGDKMTMYGSAKSDDNNAVNGEFKMSITESDKQVGEVVYSIKDLKESGESFTGTVRVDANFTSDSEAVSGWYEVTSNSSDDKTDLDMEIGINGKSFVVVEFDSTKTEASDITIPGVDAKVYDALDETQLDEYLNNCDTAGFEANLKSVLGDELYNDLLDAESDLTDDDYDYDFDDDYVLDDSDFNYFDDYDFDSNVISYDDMDVTA